MMVAADQGNSEALEVLLEAGANINCRVSRIRFCKLMTITNHTGVTFSNMDKGERLCSS